MQQDSIPQSKIEENNSGSLLQGSQEKKSSSCYKSLSHPHGALTRRMTWELYNVWMSGSLDKRATILQHHHFLWVHTMGLGAQSPDEPHISIFRINSFLCSITPDFVSLSKLWHRIMVLSKRRARSDCFLPAVSTMVMHTQGLGAHEWLLWFAMKVQSQKLRSAVILQKNRDRDRETGSGWGRGWASIGRLWGPGSRYLWPL